MYYKDFKAFAKRYSNLFHYGFDRTSLKTSLFWASIASLCGMTFFAYATVYKTLEGYIPLPATYLGMILCEGLFAAFYFMHVAHQLRKKQKKQGAYVREIDEDRAELDIRKDWLARHFPIPQEQFLKFVESVEKVENRPDSARHKKKSAFEAYMGTIFKWTKPIKLMALTIGAPVSIYAIQAFLERKPWATEIQTSMTEQNLQVLATVGGGLLAAGALITFVISMGKYLYWYYLDVVSRHGCSQPSVDRLMKDLLQLSRIEVERS